MQNRDLIHSLSTAYHRCSPLDKSVLPSTLTLEEAYRIQHAFTEAKLGETEKLAGYKVSMTSPETQAWFDAVEPLYGQLTSDQIVSGDLSLDRLMDPLIELELIFVVLHRLDGTSTEEEILKSTLIAPGIEIPDCRFTDWFPNLTKEQLCIDGAVGGKLVVGAAQEATYDTLRTMTGRLYHNDTLLDEGCASGVMGHPIRSVTWLLEKLAAHNLALEPGMVVSSGTFVLPKSVEPGTYTGEFDGIGSVSITVTA